MEKGFEDSLNDLKLKDGDKLLPHWLLSKVFDKAPTEGHLHITVERPATGESECLMGHRNSDDSISWFFHLVSGFPLPLVLTDAIYPI